jgi:putative SOS response-associated peptidase YedK
VQPVLHRVLIRRWSRRDSDRQIKCAAAPAQAAAFERAIQLGKISWKFEVSYNVTPTQQVPVVRNPTPKS